MCDMSLENVNIWMEKVLKKPMNMDNLRCYNELARAKKYMMRNLPGLSESDCKAWVEKMHPKARWTCEQTTGVMKSRGYDCDEWEFWAVMNSLYSDYGKTMTKYGMDKAEMWADLAYDWIHDEDASPEKASIYYHGIVK